MIHRKFNQLKFTRTYIDGSKENEIKKFNDVQGIKEDNSECDWFEYRRLLIQYLDDTLNVILSWKYLFNILRYIFIFLTVMLIMMKSDIFGIITILLLTIVSHFSFHYLKKSEKKRLSAYDFSLDMINQQSGVILSKN